MKYHFDDQIIPYTGKELTPLRNYLNYGLLGNSIVSWVGPCSVDFSEMVDGEDLRSQSAISSDKMLHFVIELFDVPLIAGVLLQRLFAEMLISEIQKTKSYSQELQQNSKDKLKDTLQESTLKLNLRRNGDDVFDNDKKLNISIATKSVNSVLLHIGVNVTNEGTPVPTCSLSDFNIDAPSLAKALMETLSSEWVDSLEATYKVFSVPKLS